ncbi:MAG: DUF1028 domain-containing protein [Polyangiales bacterium]
MSALRIPVSTYSIVARDPATGELGCAVQSHFFSVGPLVPWVEAGVGAVATQAMVEPSYGPRGLELMRAGDSASDALAALLEEDAQREVRQVAMVDPSGGVAAHTGAKCIAEAGHRAGEGSSVQANMMRAPTVPGAMARAFETTEGDLADRMVAALHAAEREGGDIRGKQSAAIVVHKGTSTGRPWHDRRFDLRVEDHPEPLDELARLVRLQRAYDFVERGDACLAVGDMAGARDAYERAGQLAPEAGELVFWQAVALCAAGDRDEALERFARLFEKEPVWRDLVPRLVEPGILPDEEAVRRILGR